MLRYLFLLLAAASMMITSAFAEGREPVMKQVKVPHNYYWREMYVPHLTSGPSSIDWMADGKSLVYSMQGRLWRQRIGDRKAQQITTGGGYDYQPDVSANGRRVVFTRYLDDAYEIIIRDLRTGAETKVTQNGAVNLDPRWSPDGKRIAYVTTDETGHFHIAIASVQNGVWISKRWREERISETPRYYYSQVDHELSPAWSPDGQSLTFIANPEIGYGTGALYRQPVDLSAPAEMLINEETAWRARPDWSPDGKRIAYSSFERRQWHQLWITYAEAGGYPLAFSYGDFDIDAARWSPDGKHIAYISNESGVGAIVIQDMTGGARTKLEIAEKKFSQDMGAVKLRILDEKGEATPARISIRGADGRYYAPDGAVIHADDFFDRAQSPAETMYFHTGGEAVIRAPAGAVDITVWRGFRHEVTKAAVVIEKNRIVTIDVTPGRLPNAAAFDGWRSADVHVHMNYGGVYRMTPVKLAKQADAEDLDLVFNLIVNKEQRIPDIDYFTPAPFNPEGTRATILHAQEYHTSLWGHMGLLGLKEHFLLGDYVAYPKTALHSYYPDNPTVADIAHVQGALVGYVHPFDPPAPEPSSDRKLSHALPVNAALGKLDYLEIVGFADPLTTESVWHKLLNTGLRIPAAGGTDAMTDYSSLRGPLGQNRTLVKAADSDEPDNEVAAWLGGLKAGNSVATNGPLVMLTLDGEGPGGELRTGKGASTFKLKATLSSIAPVDSLDIIVNGEVAQTIPLSGDRKSAAYEGEMTFNESAWLTLRAYSKTASPYVLDNYPFATTSPIYVSVGGKPVRSRADADHFIAWIDKLIHVAEEGSYNTDDERAAVLANLKKARREFEKRRQALKYGADMTKEIPFAIALIPAFVLIGLMGMAVWLFGDASAGGPAQIVLLVAAGAANIIGLAYGMKWTVLEEAVVHSVSRAVPASLILLAVGALIGSWMMSGTAPAMIFYSLGLISPQWFYPAAAIICACVSVSIGSSWTTAGTVGLALVGAATIMGLSPEVTAGAVIGGSYFGDKLSPLSDSTNLAAAVVGVNLFDHVRHMLTTTIPSLLIATLIFAGFSLTQGGEAAPVNVIEQTRKTLKASYDLGPLTMLPLVAVFILAIRKFPPYPTIAIGALLGGLVAVIRQPEIVWVFADPTGELPYAAAMVKGVWQALSTGFQSNLGVAELDRLLTRGGMASMMTIIWMVIAALSFAASMEATGLLERLTAPLLKRIRGVGSLVTATVFSAIAMNIFAATQYMAIIIPGRLYVKEYQKRGLKPVNLSRTVEDAGTMTSALVPWTTCGVFMAGALGVPTLEYLPYAFINLLNPTLAILFAYFGIALVRQKETAPEGAARST